MNAALTELTTRLLAATDGGQTGLPPHCAALLAECGRHSQPDWGAHMSPALAPYSQLGLTLAHAHNGNLLSAELYPALQRAEQEAAAWLCDSFGFEHAAFTHGGSQANLEALWLARDRDREGRRLVYGGAATHYSIPKACQILGLEFRVIAGDENDRLRPDALSDACSRMPPLAIVLNAGATATGMLDPLEETLALARAHGVWTHIDAAWGGALILLPENRQRFAAIAQSDSLGFDAHKALMQPRPSGVLLTHSRRARLELDAGYLSAPPDQRLAGSYGGELFLPLWLNLTLLGEAWFHAQIRERYAQAQLFASRLAQETPWPVRPSETGVVCFEPDNLDRLAPLQQRGMLSMATVAGKTVMRTVFSSASTRADTLFSALRPFL